MSFINHASTCLFPLADKIQPTEKPIAKVYSRSSWIFHHSSQQANFFCRCSVKFVLLVEESPHLEPILFLKMMSDATQSFATHQSSQSGCHASGYDLFSLSQRCPQDRLTHVQRLDQEPLRNSRKPRQPIREHECKFVETTRLAAPLVRSAETSVPTSTHASILQGWALAQSPPQQVRLLHEAAVSPIDISTRELGS